MTLEIRQTGDDELETYPVSKDYHMDEPPGLKGRYPGKWALVYRASWYVNSVNGGTCILKDASGKAMMAHPPALARELNCEWIAPLQERLPMKSV